MGAVALALVLVAWPALTRGQAPRAASEPGASQVVLQLPYYHMFNYAGFYAAVEQGYYRQAGLEVQIREGGPTFTASDKVLAGDLSGFDRGAMTKI